jgi:hypothetical protein
VDHVSEWGSEWVKEWGRERGGVCMCMYAFVGSVYMVCMCVYMWVSVYVCICVCMCVCVCMCMFVVSVWVAVWHHIMTLHATRHEHVALHYSSFIFYSLTPGDVMWCDVMWWCDGVMVWWCDGVMMWCGWWCNGVMVWWCDGVMNCDGVMMWCDVMVWWCDDVMMCRVCMQVEVSNRAGYIVQSPDRHSTRNRRVATAEVIYTRTHTHTHACMHALLCVICPVCSQF